MIFYKSDEGTLYNADALAILKTIPTESIGLVITSPPYNIGRKRKVRIDFKKKNGIPEERHFSSYDNDNDSKPHEIYIKWQKSVLAECLRIIKPGGAIFYNHKPRIQNGLMWSPLEIVSGFPIRQEIVWKRKGGINFNKSHFLPTTERIYFIPKGKFDLGAKKYLYTDVWEIAQNPSRNGHPCPFPIQLPIQIIDACPDTGTILDPFIGSGTTAMASQQFGRKWIGIEKSEKYCMLAKKNICGAQLQLFNRKNAHETDAEKLYADNLL